MIHLIMLSHITLRTVSSLGHSIQEGCWGPEACPEKGSETGDESGVQVLWGVVERAGDA